MSNYIEHEQKVKYIDGILNKSTDWQWFIDYIEKEFEIDFSLFSFDDFNSIYFKIHEIFESLNKINEIVEGNFIVRKDWLDIINQLSLYYLGLKDYEQCSFNTDFEKTFFLLIYLAKIASESIYSDTKYLIYTDIIEQNNIYKIIDVLPFEKESEYILSLFDDISYNTDKEREIFINNINKRNCDCLDFIIKNKDELLSANCFGFRNNKEHKYNSWEEQYLSHMISCRYKNNCLTPIYTDRDGTSFPNFNLWTKNVLSIMKEDFNDGTANFIIESVEYALYKKVPSNETIQLHYKLLLEYYTELGKKEHVSINKYNCSSLEFAISFQKDKNIEFNSNNRKLFNKALKEIKDIHFLVNVDSRCAIHDKSLKSKIKSFVNEKLKSVETIRDSNGFLSSIHDKDIVTQADKSTFECLSDKFEMCIEASSGVDGSTVFLEYLLFLLKIKNNRRIVAKDISAEIIYIRKLWQEIYYKKCQSSMHCFSNKTSIPNEEISNHNDSFFEKPIAVAYSCMELKKDDLINTMESISNHPFFSLVTNIEISEDFPKYTSFLFDDRHPVDLIFRKYAKKIRDDNSYKFLNPFKIEEFLPQIYWFINQKITMYFCLFNKTEELYKIVAKQNSNYELLDYSDEPLLAHLTQLFPIVENKVREYGEMIGIPSICELSEKYYRLKEPSSILNKIITEIHEQTGTLDYAADFLFIHYCLFGENGLNIRNKCLHGVRYTKDKSSIYFALKITLFCLYLLDYRINLKYSDSDKS